MEWYKTFRVKSIIYENIWAQLFPFAIVRISKIQKYEKVEEPPKSSRWEKKTRKITFSSRKYSKFFHTNSFLRGRILTLKVENGMSKKRKNLKVGYPLGWCRCKTGIKVFYTKYFFPLSLIHLYRQNFLHSF